MLQQRYIDREKSWLAFNARVLQEAGDVTVPLLDRMRFLGIFSIEIKSLMKQLNYLRKICNLNLIGPQFLIHIISGTMI